MLSSASVRSLYVLFELGARWGARRQMIPLLALGTPTSVLGGALAGLNARSAGSVPQLHQLLSELAAALSLDLESAAGYHDHLQAVADLTPRSVGSHPEDSTRVSGADSDLPREAQGILKTLVTSNANGRQLSPTKCNNITSRSSTERSARPSARPQCPAYRRRQCRRSRTRTRRPPCHRT